MRALLTGASSFSGYWFAAKLHAAGFEVFAPLRRAASAYEGVRAERVQNLVAVATVVPDCPFGSSRFMTLVSDGGFDVLCHHAARVRDYGSLDFDVVQALAENTNNIRKIIEAMLTKGLRAIVLTGSVFEANEGAGNWPMRAFSPYGLSKGLTSEVLRHFHIPFGKFLISNPFGPFEEPRFCTYLINTWHAGQVAEVRTPSYLRDNIHVDLLALSYARFVKHTIETGASERFGPIGYAETQGAFTERFASAMRSRLGWDCSIKLLEQTDFSEPLMRVNTHPVDTAALGWSEAAAWDSIAQYYRTRT
jgi:UDP-glucose 4-epimerase